MLLCRGHDLVKMTARESKLVKMTARESKLVEIGVNCVHWHAFSPILCCADMKCAAFSPFLCEGHTSPLNLAAFPLFCGSNSM